MGWRKHSNKVSQKYLRQILLYDPHSGHFYWSAPRPKIRVGDLAGNRNSGDGYIYIGINGRLYAAHRLAWLYMTGEWPQQEIDHKNRIRDDNVWTNLREATYGQNQINCAPRPSKLGIRGVVKKGSSYHARISFRGKRIFVGAFSTSEEASTAYFKKAKELYGDFVGPM